MSKIPMNGVIVELDGDEMTRVLWRQIKEELLLPFVELRTEYYDLGLPNRDATDDRVTSEASHAIRRHRVGVKCATITPNAARMEEYHLKRMYPSPNATLRAILDGTVFRTPITTPCIPCRVPGWQKPITIARHAYGDIYKASEIRVPGKGTATLSFRAEDGTETTKVVREFPAAGVLLSQYNEDASILSFARSCFRYALDLGQDLWFSAKDTISGIYDGTFRDVFERVYDEEFRAEFERKGIGYRYLLIDSAVAGAITSAGGFVWACKNYDGDVMSDLISAAFGSIAMMTSVLVSPDGCFEYEAAHGTVTDHYRAYQAGKSPSTNPTATIFAWTGAIRKRGELDGNEALRQFADRLEKACLETIEQGVMTEDLTAITGKTPVDCPTFLKAIRAKLEA